MPTVKISQGAYEKLVKLAGSLQKEQGKIVSVGEALNSLLNQKESK